MKTRFGTTLTELVLVMTLLGIVCTLAAPQARRGLDQMRVRSARESTLAIAMHARALAIAHGGADLVVDLKDLTVSAVETTGTVAEHALLSAYDVTVESDPSSATRLVLRFDALGIGRMASRTLRFRRGQAEAGLTISSYGRIRRW